MGLRDHVELVNPYALRALVVPEAANPRSPSVRRALALGAATAGITAGLGLISAGAASADDGGGAASELSGHGGVAADDSRLTVRTDADVWGQLPVDEGSQLSVVVPATEAVDEPGTTTVGRPRVLDPYEVARSGDSVVGPPVSPGWIPHQLPDVVVPTQDEWSEALTSAGRSRTPEPYGRFSYGPALAEALTEALAARPDAQPLAEQRYVPQPVAEQWYAPQPVVEPSAMPQPYAQSGAPSRSYAEQPVFVVAVPPQSNTQPVVEQPAMPQPMFAAATQPQWYAPERVVEQSAYVPQRVVEQSAYLPQQSPFRAVSPEVAHVVEAVQAENDELRRYAEQQAAELAQFRQWYQASAEDERERDEDDVLGSVVEVAKKIPGIGGAVSVADDLVSAIF